MRGRSGLYARRVKRKPDWVLDVAPVAVTVLAGVVTVIRGHPTTQPWLVGPALIVAAGALALSARAPLIVLAFVLALVLAFYAGPTMLLPALFALFAVTRLRDRPVAIGAALVTGVVFVVSRALHTSGLPLPSLIPEWVAIGLAVAAGLYVRTRADQLTGMARQAAAEERVRIARELHDVVAHNVSLMIVQAQALAATSRTGEERVGLDRVAGLGREAMAEMHRMLGLLRLDGAAAERAPQPGVGELEALVAHTTAAGVRTELGIEGEPRELPPAVDLSAYRIVQEALTNVVRHAQAGHVQVTLSYLPDEVRVAVIDDGDGDGGAGGGHGLVGMRERVALFGGTLTTGSRHGASGYQVRATLPVG